MLHALCVTLSLAAAKFFETPEEAAAKRKQTALKKKLAERRAGANPNAGLKVVDQANNVGSEIKRKDDELERLRATQLARLQLAEQHIKELEAAKLVQAETLATQTAELKQLSQAKAAADAAKSQAGEHTRVRFRIRICSVGENRCLSVLVTCVRCCIVC